MIVSRFVILTLVILGSFQAVFINADLSSEFTNSADLDEAETVILYWSVDWDAKTVSFAVEALTTGWVGFGISAGRGQMIGADIVIGGVTDDGNHYFMVGKIYFVKTHRFCECSSCSPVAPEI